MKILITGSSGMLGKALCRELCSKYEIIGLDIQRDQKPEAKNRKYNFIEQDITQRDETIKSIVGQKPATVIHAAAYTDVDDCEHNPERTDRVNVQATETIALACRKCRAFLCYISTDFVFDGQKKVPYIEEDLPNPINIYGQSKLAGERYVQSILKEFIIVRSSWLFGQGGRNFVDTFLRKAQNKKRIEVVNDQFGSPTYTKDLAQAINRLVDLSDRLKGIYHITNSDSCSWFEFALAIKEITNLNANIVPIPSKGYCSSTRRPKMSILDNRRYRELRGKQLRPWKQALQEYLAEVKDGCARIRK